jgi:MFS transporter, FSR family, fosmidomycin resistance protein
MAVTAPTDGEAGAPAHPAEERRALAVAGGAHALHDGYTDLIYVVLPLVQAEFGLAYGAVGLLRTIYSGTMASFQIPASMLAERIGIPVVLAVGTALAGACFCLAGVSAGFPMLVAALLLGGFGASTQHPIGSALVARAFAGSRALTALGTYNFAGDIGKMVVPAAASMLLLVMAWRPTVAVLGAVGFVAAIAIFLLAPRFPPEHAEVAHAQKAEGTAGAAEPSLRPGFRLLLTIAAIDSATRAGFLVFLPFLMIAKGTSVTTAGLALTLTFVGGATGKLVCAYLGRWFGVIATICLTKLATAVGMMAILVAPAGVALVLLPPFGAMLNGASSVTYGSVPDFVTPAGRTRAFSLFYTGTLGAGAVAPTLSGLAGDALGIPTTIVIIAALMLASLPLAWLLRPAFADRAAV